MAQALFYRAGSTPGCRYAQRFLEEAGIPFIGHVSPEITHLLLDVPSFSGDGTLRGGGDPGLLLRMLPKSVTVLGGGLDLPLLAGKQCIDLLQDEAYLARNAAITAHCTLQIITQKLSMILPDARVLILGWGRIGKCLAALLRNLGASVTVAARKEADRSMVQALGMASRTPEGRLDGYHLIVNTIPAPLAVECPGESLVIDLASHKGISGEQAVWARGLPGICAPESSGKAIALAVLRKMKEEIR